MSTMTTTNPSGASQSQGADAARTGGAGRPGIPMSRLLHVELRKLVDTRSGRWLLITIGLVTALAIGLVLAFSPRDQLTFSTFVAATSMPQMLLLPVLGILTVTAEHSQRTGLVTFAQEPRRLRVVAAKLLAASIVGVLAVLLSLALAAVAALTAVALKDAPGGWSWSWATFGGNLLAELLSVWQGVAFGLLITSPGAAIAVFFILPTVMTIVVSAVRWLKDSAPWIDQSLATRPLLGGTMSGQDWAHLATSHGIWVLLPLLVGAWMLVRREIK